MTFETIRLIRDDEQWVYIPRVAHENEGRAVRFVSTTISMDYLVFENKNHDFPQQISYARVRPDSLVAEISGTVNGVQRSQSFSMKRVTP